MPRKGRETSGTGIYHVMLRGINRQDIFEDSQDYREFIKILSSGQNRLEDAGQYHPFQRHLRVFPTSSTTRSDDTLGV